MDRQERFGLHIHMISEAKELRHTDCTGLRRVRSVRASSTLRSQQCCWQPPLIKHPEVEGELDADAIRNMIAAFQI
jgi:hypothetical protein